MIKSTLLIFGLLCPVVFAIEPAIPDELREAMRARHEAFCKADTDTWSRLTSDEFTVVVPEGKLLTKSERLNSLKNKKARPVSTLQQQQIHRYGDTLVRRFVDDNKWILEVWVLQQGAWRVVASQVNYIK